jgi:hypothetical protein
MRRRAGPAGYCESRYKFFVDLFAQHLIPFPRQWDTDPNENLRAREPLYLKQFSIDENATGAECLCTQPVTSGHIRIHGVSQESGPKGRDPPPLSGGSPPSAMSINLHSESTN